MNNTLIVTLIVLALSALLIQVATGFISSAGESLEGRLASGNVDQNEYTEIVQQMIKEQDPTAQVSITGPLQLSVEINGHQLSANLGNAWDAGQQSPSGFPQVTRAVVEALFSSASAASEPVDPNRIVPVIKPSTFIDKANGASGDSRWASDPFGEDLFVVYACDKQNRIAFPSERDMIDAGISRSELRETALDNLRNIVGPVKCQIMGPLCVIAADETYESSLILSTPLCEDMAKRVQGDLVACIPNRHTLIFTGSDSAEGMAGLRRVAASLFAEGPYSLTQSLFVRRQNRWMPYK